MSSGTDSTGDAFGDIFGVFKYLAYYLREGGEENKAKCLKHAGRTGKYRHRIERWLEKLSQNDRPTWAEVLAMAASEGSDCLILLQSISPFKDEWLVHLFYGSGFVHLQQLQQVFETVARANGFKGHCEELVFVFPAKLVKQIKVVKVEKT